VATPVLEPSWHRLGALAGRDPQVVARASGLLAVLVAEARGDGPGPEGGLDLALYRSRTEGDLWEPRTVVNLEPGTVVAHGEGSPRLLLGPRMTLCAVWAGGAGEEASLRARCSEDFGATFGPELRPGVPARVSFFTAALSGEGTLAIAYLAPHPEARPGTSQLGVISSTDRKVFGAPTTVALDVCPCCRPALIHGEGLWHLAYRGVDDREVRDVLYTRAPAPSGPWAPPSPVADDGWKVEGCPHSGPALTLASGRLHAAWFTGAGARARLVTASTAPGARGFGRPETLGPKVADANHPAFALVAGTLFATFEGRDASAPGGFGGKQAFLAPVGGGGAVALSLPTPEETVGYPVAAALGPESGVALWTAVTAKGPQVRFRRFRRLP
jgi:hypothetical protein